MKKVMAVILNYNSIEDSIKCAKLLKKQEAVDLETVIIDNDSNDDRLEELKDFCLKNDIMFIENKENRGFSAGNNVGLRKAAEKDYPYAIIVNPDVEIRDREYISKAIEKMEKDEQIAVLGTDIINIRGQHQNPIREPRVLEQIFWPYAVIKNKLSKKLPYVCDFTKSGYCEKVSGCCFFVRMSFLKKAEYLDENVFLYSEEPILSAKVKKEKMKEYYMHNLKAYHMHKTSEKGNPSKNFEMLVKSREYYLKEYTPYSRSVVKMITFSNRIQNKFIFKKK